MFVFVVSCSIPFPHKTSDFSVYPGLSVLYFCCFVWDELIYGSFQFRCNVMPKLIYRG